MTELKRQCYMWIPYGIGLFYPCRGAVIAERDGKLYCIIHDPEYVRAKNAKRNAEWDAKPAADKARRAWQDARDTAVEGLTTEELKRVTPALIREIINRDDD